MVEVICACCKKNVDHESCYRMYVGMGSNDFICKECQKKPFIEVMENSLWSESYIGEPPKTLDQLQSEKELKIKVE